MPEKNTIIVRVCVPRGDRAINAYQPPNPGSCTTSFSYCSGICVPKR